MNIFGDVGAIYQLTSALMGWARGRRRSRGKPIAGSTWPLSAEGIAALQNRRAQICRLRAARWQRAHLRNGRPTRRIPRHIKLMMREASPRSR